MGSQKLKPNHQHKEDDLKCMLFSKTGSANEYKYLNKCKKNLYVCFVDFKKAFDSVVRKALMYTLLCKGIGGKFYDLLKHMYSNTLYEDD
jgi:hypothetical protein